MQEKPNPEEQNSEKSNPEEPISEEEFAKLSFITNQAADEIDQLKASYLFGEREIYDYVTEAFAPSESDQRPSEEIMAIALAEAIQDVFSADEKGRPHPDRYPAPSVERTSAPPCVETVLKYHGFSVCIHLIGLSDESCRLTMLFMGRCRDRQQLFELSQLWSQSLLSTCLSVDIDSEDGLVLSGDLPVPPDFMMVLRMALKRAISGLVIPKTKAYLLAMLQCFGPV